jgi:DNA-directed RNA polymerase I subunit RPA43
VVGRVDGVVGVVNKQSPDHIGVLVHGVFNASIEADQMRGVYSWNEDEHAWVHDATGDVVENDVELAFTVTRLIVENDILSISGSLIDVAVNEPVVASSSQRYVWRL